ncbi:UbiA family prenyltransferase [Planctomonas sp. JC2975]|uniref:UbiA family prenyltransferase n=1 Tax=Planctomonas sp. JC2975 TaxID=2729626 RepID=UPI0014766B31|nr:UbiA family prenyltransferase [Planctomonas sp. JC2975]NNC10806.1 UbiA family prenyltransferase [Planctomonas sp. JC2975]
MPKAVRALTLASHPGPALVVTVVAAVLAIAVAYPAWRVVLLTAAMLADQLSVGWSNDWIDAARDSAVARADKPIAAHAITRRTVGIAAFVALGLALVLTVPFGPVALVAHVVALGSAWSYNAGLKRTLFSVVPYLVSFGTLPAIVTLGAPTPQWPAWWVVAAGSLLGAAAHVTNVLPDLEQDRITGVRGFGHLLGPRIGGLVSFGLLAVVGVLIAVGAVALAGLSGWPSVLVIVGSVITVAIACLGVVLTLRGVHSRWLMRLIMTAALVDVIALVAAGPVLSV